MIFNKDMISDEAQRSNYEKRREKAYLGSRMHLFRSLWANNYRTEGFDMECPKGEDFNYNESIVSDSTNRKFLVQQKRIKVGYRWRYSSIENRKRSICFSSNGYFDGDGIFWEGEMAMLRVADWLPLEYQLTND